MYNLAFGSHSAEEMLDILTKDRTVWYEFDLLDKDDAPLGKITAEGSIDYNSQTGIQRCASLTIKEEKDIDFLSERIRPSMCLKTNTGIVHYPLGVFLMSSPKRKAGTGFVGRGIECYDKCQILSDDKFDTRYRIPAGTNYIGAVSSILSSAGITDAQLTVSNKTLAADLEFDMGTSKLDAVNALLKALNYNNIYADANGKLVAKEYEDPILRPAETTYATNSKSIIFDGAEEELDIFNAPNKIIRYLETADRDVMIATVVNNDPLSKLSTVSRGRTIVDVDRVTDIADQATLEAYTQREAAEKKIYQKIIFETAAMPNHESLDCLYIINKDLNVQGKYIELSWHLDMQVGGHMRHICRRAVSI